MAAQSRRLGYYHTFSSMSNEPQIRLADRLLGLVPGRMSKVFFANSGSEANDTQVKLVWYYNNLRGKPRKKKIISRLGGYHGSTVAAASLTGLPMFHRAFDLPLAERAPHEGAGLLSRRGAGATEEAYAATLVAELERPHRARGPGHGRRLHRRAGHGRRRRAGSAPDVLRSGPGRAPEARHPHDRRRGHLRVRSARAHVRLRGVRHRARPDDRRQGAHERLLPALGRDHLRARVVGAPGRVARGRRLRPRLHLQRTPGRRGRRDGQPGHPPRRGPDRQRGADRRLHAGGSPGAHRRAPAGGGRPGRRSRRRHRARGRPREPPAVRRRAEGEPAGRGPVPRGRADRARAPGRATSSRCRRRSASRGSRWTRWWTASPAGSEPSATSSCDRARGRPPSARGPGSGRGGPPGRARPSGRGSPRPSPRAPGLDLAEGQGRARRVGRGVRAARGRRGDRLRLSPRARDSARAGIATGGAATRVFATGR